MCLKSLMISAILLLATSSTALANTFNSAERTVTHTIASEALGEQRTIIVRTPPGYDSTRTYPVVYLGDGEWIFEMVASYLDYMADNDVYPGLIVTGVTNVNRNRDYVPAVDAHFEDTGGADRFLDFVQREWIPFMEEHYASGPDRVLLGHSFGGVITLHTFFTRSNLFNAYIALGTSAWIADRVLFKEAQAWFEEPHNTDAFVFMAAGEGDGGPTTPTGSQLADQFEANAPGSLDWTFEITPRTDHFKNAVSGLHDAFMALFPAWGFDKQLTELGTNGGAEGVKGWFAGKESELGYRFIPAWFDLGIAAISMLSAGHGEAALATMQGLRKHHPDNPHVAAFSAHVFEQTGSLSSAAEEYRRTIMIARRDGLHPNEIHLGRIERGLERVTVSMNEQDQTEPK